MKNRFLGALLFSFVCIAASTTQAGDFTTDPAQWPVADCGNSFPLNLSSLQKDDETTLFPDEVFAGVLPNNQSLGWGTLSQANFDPDGIIVSTGNGFILTTPLLGNPTSLTPAPANGMLNGFCLRYASQQADIRIFDGTTLVDSFTTVIGQSDPADPATFICWENTDGVNVTRIEVEPNATPDVPTIGIPLSLLDGEFRFECVAPEPATCFEQMADVRADVDALLASTTDSCDAYFLENAVELLDWMQNDVFWEQPSGDRLSQYGGSLFIGAAYTVCYLEYVDDPAADALIDDLLDVLECIVDNEIAYAIANDGNTCYIENAEYFAELGTIIDEDFENEVIATLAYRLAWLNAYHATK